MKLPVEYLIPKYQDNLYQAAYAILQNIADSQDAVQMTFIKYYQNDQDYQNEEHIRKWLFRTIMNQAKDIRRSFWRKSRSELNEATAGTVFETSQDQSLFDAVSGLDAKYRIILQLYYYEEFTIREIAALTGLSQSTVKKRLERGRKLLREQLDGESRNE